MHETSREANGQMLCTIYSMQNVERGSALAGYESNKYNSNVNEGSVTGQILSALYAARPYQACGETEKVRHKKKQAGIADVRRLYASGS